MFKKLMPASFLAALFALLPVALPAVGPAQAAAAGGSSSFSSRLVSSMTTRRSGASAATLPDGRVLIAGGSNFGFVQTAELFDPTTETFTALGSGHEMAASRFAPAVAPLPDGDVLIAGGAGNGYLSSVELFDPASQTFSSLGAGHELQIARFGAVAVPLAGGDILIAGGEREGGPATTAELFDPSTDTFTLLGGSEHEMREGRRSPVAAPLPDGGILIAGGSASNQVLASAEVFDPATQTFTLLTGAGRYMSTPRADAVAGPLTSGQVLIAGGSNGIELASAETFDPATKTFTALTGTGQSLDQPRVEAVSAQLPGGRVLIAGGRAGAGAGLASAEVIDVSPARAVIEGGDFGAQTVGRPAGTQTLVVDAVGGQPLSIDGAAITGPDQQDFLITGDSCEGLVLSFRQICTITARFTPSAPGARSAALVLHDNEVAASAVPLNGTGVVPESGPRGAPGAAAAPAPAAATCSPTRLQLWITRAPRATRGPITVKVDCGWKHLPATARVHLARGGLLFASGVIGSGDGTPRITLRRRRVIRAGRYTLTLITGHGVSARGTSRSVTISGA